MEQNRTRDARGPEAIDRGKVLLWVGISIAVLGLLTLSRTWEDLRPRGPVSTWMKPWQGSRSISHVSSPMKFECVPQRRSGQRPYVIVYEVVGNIEGSATLTICGQKQLELSGRVREFHADDWYEGICPVDYYPRNVEQGHLRFSWKCGYF